MLQGVEIFGVFDIFAIFSTFFRVQDRLNSIFWWLVTSVVAFASLPDILSRWWGPMNDIFSFFLILVEWWGYLNPNCYNPIHLNFLRSEVMGTLLL